MAGPLRLRLLACLSTKLVDHGRRVSAVGRCLRGRPPSAPSVTKGGLSLASIEKRLCAPMETRWRWRGDGGGVGGRCQTLVLEMPVAASLSSHRVCCSQHRHLMVSFVLEKRLINDGNGRADLLRSRNRKLWPRILERGGGEEAGGVEPGAGWPGATYSGRDVSALGGATPNPASPSVIVRQSAWS